MAELWELVDINKEKTGIIYERGKESLIPEGMYHMVASVWIKNEKGEILLTQRHPDKNLGLLWECTGGAVVMGESCVEGASRELFEETGIKIPPNELTYIGDTIKSYWIVEIYLGKVVSDEIELKLQKEEVVDAVWILPEQMEEKKDVIVNSVWEGYCQYKDYLING